MKSLLARCRRRGVLRSWGSVARVSIWVVVWCAVASAVVAPRLPHWTDREIVPDDPPSNVRYVAPVSRADKAGYLPPQPEPDTFRVAWIGGSEVKLRQVSIPGAVEQRIGTVGGRRLVVDTYNLIAPRMIDTVRAIDTATASDVDAIVVALNPAWTRSEFSMRGWENLDVSNIGSLWSNSSTWSWALALTGPDDVAWRVTRAAFPLVEAQTRLNERARDELDRIDVVLDPAEPRPDDGDPRLPPSDAFWLVQHYGTDVVDDEDVRVTAIMNGTGVAQDEARFFAELMIDELERSGVPVFLYATPFAPESLADPEFDAAARSVESFWASVGATIDSPLVDLEPQSLSRDGFPAEGTFINNVHMANPGPFADLLVQRLCTQWRAADPTQECG